MLTLLASTWLAYAPGLTGGFQFDDYANLPALGATGPMDNWATFWRYITSGKADPTGRPLALLSFLIDARDWPADPQPFLRTGIIIHIINGLLLSLVLRRLGRNLLWAGAREEDTTTATRVALAALLGAALWLLHPLLVSTTLYIVQREAMMATTFTLLGLLAWLEGRRRLLGGCTPSGLVWLATGLVACTALGMLSKANGILLPALALLIEATILRSTHPGNPIPRRCRIYRCAMAILAGLPTAFIAFYLLHRGYNGFVHGISATRPWTLGQRLLTEPRVLTDYLQLLWLPRPFTPGLFNDQIAASTSLFFPWSTLPCLLTVVGLIGSAWLLRKRLPVVALAILFYFVGQALESSTIALELYYEHRNYLPAMLMFWPLALWLCGVPQILRKKSVETGRRSNEPVTWRWIKTALSVLLVVSLAGMTHARASVWGNTHEQALLWAKLNPDSPRAQANAAMADMHAGHPARAIPRLRHLLRRKPDQVQLALNLFAAECLMGHVTPSTLEASSTALAATHNPGALLMHWFGRAINRTAHPPCPELNLGTLASLVHSAQSNPRLMTSRSRRQDLDSILGRIALARGRPAQALSDFNHALAQDVRISAALEQAALLGSHGYPQRGLMHLSHYEQIRKQQHMPRFGMPRIHDWVLKRQHYWQKELVRLRKTLQNDADYKEERVP